MVLTDAALRGWPALLLTLATSVVGALWYRRGRRRGWLSWLPVGIVAVLIGLVMVPTASTTRRIPAPLPSVAMEFWELPTGSRVAVYHYPSATTAPAVPVLFLHGGPITNISLADHRLLAQLAERGFDVYAYEQAGGGRSDLLDIREYSIDRSVRDLQAFLDRLGTPADVIGYSAGGVLLAQTLARPGAATRIHSAVFAESGPMDGPTAAILGPVGRPNAGGLVPSPVGSVGVPPPRYGVAFGLTRLGWLGPENGLTSQEEALNAFGQQYLGSELTSSYCAADAAHV